MQWGSNRAVSVPPRCGGHRGFDSRRQLADRLDSRRQLGGENGSFVSPGRQSGLGAVAGTSVWPARRTRFDSQRHLAARLDSRRQMGTGNGAFVLPARQFERGAVASTSVCAREILRLRSLRSGRHMTDRDYGLSAVRGRVMLSGMSEANEIEASRARRRPRCGRKHSAPFDARGILRLRSLRSLRSGCRIRASRLTPRA